MITAEQNCSLVSKFGMKVMQIKNCADSKLRKQILCNKTKLKITNIVLLDMQCEKPV